MKNKATSSRHTQRQGIDTVERSPHGGSLSAALSKEVSPREQDGAGSPPDVPVSADSERGEPDAWHVGEYSLYGVPGRLIRVALDKNAKRAIFFSAGNVEIRSGEPGRVNTQGSLSFKMSSSSHRTICEVPGAGKREFALPCTLKSSNELNIITYNGTSYRGSMILAIEGRGFLSVINYCDVEDYLRGVIPLEIGNCGKEGVEAIKAQAVAARTYTYKKILGCQRQLFDLLPDISDQVYGGVNAEKAICNQAIRDTRDLVVVYPGAVSDGISGDSLIFAYYHSTCGGKTANVDDVWDKSKLPYLRSIKDCDENGRPFCSASWSFSWQDSWPIDRLSKIVNRFSRETFPQNPTSGTIQDIVINDRYACGRTKTCRVKTAAGVFTYGGDKLRFVLRRNMDGFPLLRSAVITDISKSAGVIVIKGRGHGHGVGMCQFGAIGRAHAGQNYEQIIKAYYTGVEIRCIGVR